MSEIEIVEAIDAAFYFDSDEEYDTATRLACSISDNAVLMVGYQLATRRSHASMDVNLRLLQIMKAERPTPVILAALPVIETLLKNEHVPSADVQWLLEACRQHGNAWNGLGIVECADSALEETCNEMRNRWGKASSQQTQRVRGRKSRGRARACDVNTITAHTGPPA